MEAVESSMGSDLIGGTRLNEGGRDVGLRLRSDGRDGTGRGRVGRDGAGTRHPAAAVVLLPSDRSRRLPPANPAHSHGSRSDGGDESAEAISDDEIAAALLAIHALRQRRAAPSEAAGSAWRRAAREEAMDGASAGWRASGWGR
jgi:hypothetical protein